MSDASPAAKPPGTPTPEVCDGIDNDCNGQVDDLAGVAGGDVNNCGGCNVRCQAPANSAAACVNGGCAWTCAAGTVDLDRDPANGCECRVTNAGVELCDGVVVSPGTGIMRSIDTPGVYSGFWPGMPHSQWKRIVLAAQGLRAIVARLRRLERATGSASDEGTADSDKGEA